MASKKRTFPVDPTIRSSIDTTFPHCWDRKLCYIEFRDGALSQPAARSEIRDAVRRAYRGESQLYCAWPGQWRTDLFVIDDLEKAAKALGVDLTVPPRPEWTPPPPPTPDEEAKSRWRGIHIRAAYGSTVDEIVRWFKSTREEVESALAVAPSEEEARDIAAVAKRLRSNDKAAATRARNKAAKEAASES